LALTLHGAAPARAQEPQAEEPVAEDVQACIDAFSRGQELRRKGELRASRDRLLACAKPQCPQPIGEKCVQWVGELGQAIPTVVVVARDAKKRDVTDVRVIVDGKMVQKRLDGRALELDPGAHHFRFERKGMRPIERRLLIVERQKGRRIDVALVPPPRRPPPPEQEVERTISPAAWVGIGVGALGLIAGAVTGGVAAQRLDELEERCTVEWQGQHYCLESDQSALDEGRTLADVSTVSFVVGGAALAVGIVALAVSLTTDPDERALRLGPKGLEGRF
jgi:hypothetical protein